jgi:hypothetical protein
MTTTLLDRVPVDEITAQAKRVRFWRTVLTLVAGALYGLGWVTARAFALVWLAASWCWVAVREGWRASRGPSRGARLETQAAEIHDLRTRLQRFGE